MIFRTKPLLWLSHLDATVLCHPVHNTLFTYASSSPTQALRFISGAKYMTDTFLCATFYGHI